MTEAEPLQQVDRTFVLHRGRRLSCFSGCDYYRLSSHPAVLDAMRAGLDRFGLNVAASRVTTGHHRIYSTLEKELVKFFRVQAALVVSDGYVATLTVAQALAGNFSHVLIDERAHAALQDAALLMDCPILRFRHRDPEDLAQTIRRCGQGTRLIVLTDGLFSQSGLAAPLKEYLRRLPHDGWMLVDDAHGAGVLGRNGRGTAELEGVNDRRVIRCVTLSKAFGVFGGAILGTAALRKRMFDKSRMLIGSTPMPLPLANAAVAALKVVARDRAMRQRLFRNVQHVREGLRKGGMRVPEAPGPIVAVMPRSHAEAMRLKRHLLAAGILPPFIRYPGGPESGCFRFAISSEHSVRQLDALVRAAIGAVGSRRH